MSVDNDKPYVLRVAELIYSQVVKIKNENSEMTNIQAFEVFMTTKDYDLISSGEFHDKWFLELKNNDFANSDVSTILFLTRYGICKRSGVHSF